MSIDWGNASVTAALTAVLTGIGYVVHVLWLGRAAKQNLITDEKRKANRHLP